MRKALPVRTSRCHLQLPPQGTPTPQGLPLVSPQGQLMGVRRTTLLPYPHSPRTGAPACAAKETGLHAMCTRSTAKSEPQQISNHPRVHAIKHKIKHDVLSTASLHAAPHRDRSPCHANVPVLTLHWREPIWAERPLRTQNQAQHCLVRTPAPRSCEHFFYSRACRACTDVGDHLRLRGSVSLAITIIVL
jgi:hypothetical protein